ncbi:Uncharacterised protein [Mycobacterium tuberculosis]|nr:Uncharacterised protein [Mycobacterium tuberculosis]
MRRTFLICPTRTDPDRLREAAISLALWRRDG